jgi:hypothetical protein
VSVRGAFDRLDNKKFKKGNLRSEITNTSWWECTHSCNDADSFLCNSYNYYPNTSTCLLYDNWFKFEMSNLEDTNECDYYYRNNNNNNKVDNNNFKKLLNSIVN